MTDSSALGDRIAPALAQQPSRVILRVEMPDGQYFELEAENPLSLTCNVSTPIRDVPECSPEALLSVLPARIEASSVKMSFQAGLGRSPMTYRTDVAESPQAKLAAIRELVDGTLDLPDGPAAAGVLVSRLMGILGRAVTP